MAKKILTQCFPYIVSYYVLMLVAYGIGASHLIIGHFLPQWTFIPSTSVPYDVIGWFWTAIASIYCGGVALLNVFTSRNLQDLSGVETSKDKLHRIATMNYFACFYCFVIKMLGVDIPLEAIVSAAGACTVLVVAGKKGSEAVIQHEEHSDDEELAELAMKLELRRASGKFEDADGSGVDDVSEALEKRIEERKREISGGLLKRAKSVIEKKS